MKIEAVGTLEPLVMIWNKTGKKTQNIKSERPDLRPAFAVIRFTRLHQGAQKGDATNLGSLSEPHREQNPYANPKRTAKSFRS